MVANRFCFAGMILVTLSCLGFLFIVIFSIKDVIFWLILSFGMGLNLMAATAFGVETFNAYHRTREHIKRFGRVGENFRFETYCEKAGYRLAIKESRLMPGASQ